MTIGGGNIGGVGGGTNPADSSTPSLDHSTNPNSCSGELKLELKFEYLMGVDKMQWITVVSSQVF